MYIYVYVTSHRVKDDNEVGRLFELENLIHYNTA